MNRRKVILLTVFIVVVAVTLALLVGVLNQTQKEEEILPPREKEEVALVQPEGEPILVVEVVSKTTAEYIGAKKYYDVPLSDELQDYIFSICEEKNICPSLIIAMIELESNYDPLVIGDKGDSLGIMQVQPKWHWARMKKLGCTDLLDPYQNITVAIDYIDELRNTNTELSWVLMAYNKGSEKADEMVETGVISDYALIVLKRLGELEKEREQWD